MPTILSSITELPKMAGDLSPENREILNSIFHISTTTGELSAPEAMHAWINKLFGSLDAVTRQRIVKITNLVTMEGALFNELRASRPLELKCGEELPKTIAQSLGDPFCHPLDGTPSDVFGRVSGRNSITASNVAKYDGHHGLVIFSEHDPLVLSADKVRDYFQTALRWAETIHAGDKEALYYFFLWNCLWKSGASIVHGHAQMTVTRAMHYAKIEDLRRRTVSYRQSKNRNYFDDLFRIHESLGLAWRRGDIRGFAYLTPIKEKEIFLMAAQEGDALYDEAYRVLDRFQCMGVRSFNAALCRPPLAADGEDWQGFPAIIRLVDRGDPDIRTADFGGMELYAASVIASDPCKVAAWMRD